MVYEREDDESDFGYVESKYFSSTELKFPTLSIPRCK